MSDENDSNGFGRRGALAALLGSAAVVTAAGTAKAAPASNVRKFSSAASPIETTIASAPLASYVYRTLTYQDFLPLDPSASARTFSGSGGVYGASVLEATMEIPAGALLREVEWYIANSSGSDAVFYCALWTPADGFITLFAPTTVPSGGGALTATKTTVTSDNWGPYPAGAKLYLYASTSATVLLNGVRLAFSGGGLEASIRSAPVMIYNSTTDGGKYTAGQKRTITIDSVVAGTTAVILRVITSGSTTNGTVKIWPFNLAEPDIGSANILANSPSIAEITVGMNTARFVSIKPSSAANVRLDLVGVYR